MNQVNNPDITFTHALSKKKTYVGCSTKMCFSSVALFIMFLLLLLIIYITVAPRGHNKDQDSIVQRAAQTYKTTAVLKTLLSKITSNI